MEDIPEPQVAAAVSAGPVAESRSSPETTSDLGTDLVSVPLVELAHGRSGDKGNSSNIGIIARRPEVWPWLRSTLTPEVVASHFAHLTGGDVERYELPGLGALNFVLGSALGGGGMASLRSDPLGKSFAQILLDMPIDAPAELVR